MLRKYTVTEPTTLKNFTDVTDAQASFAFKTLLRTRQIRVCGRRAEGDLPLKAGDEVSYYLTERQEKKRAFSTVYEDDSICVIDKESGVNTEAVLSALCKDGQYFSVHRLDRNTEGLIVFAKTEEACSELLACFRERRAEKFYLCLVFGTPDPPAGVFFARLEKDAAHARVRIGTRGERIETAYETVENRGETALLRVRLNTGRTHQIRAHLAYLGYPVVGDEKYGDPQKNAALHKTRQQLVAKELTLFPAGALAYLYGKTFFSEKNL